MADFIKIVNDEIEVSDARLREIEEEMDRQDEIDKQNSLDNNDII